VLAKTPRKVEVYRTDRIPDDPYQQVAAQYRRWSLLFRDVIIPRRDSVRGIVFWNSVVKFQSSADYADRVVSTEPAMLTRALLADAYDPLRFAEESTSRWEVQSGRAPLER
jgi:hypothetical protein